MANGPRWTALAVKPPSYGGIFPTVARTIPICCFSHMWYAACRSCSRPRRGCTPELPSSLPSPLATSAGLAEGIVMSPLVRPAIAALAIGLVPAITVAQVGPEKPKSPEQVRQRLTEPQVAVRFAPDGLRFVVCGQNSGIRQFDRMGIELVALKNAPGGWSVAYSPDGKTIAACG